MHSQKLDKHNGFEYSALDNRKLRQRRAGDFGKIISTSNNPRLIQFGAKFSF